MTDQTQAQRIALGCMSFGDTSRGFNEWALDDTAAEPLFRQAVELGITFWDTANAYGYGTSEEIVGRAIGKYTRREDVVLATKVFFTMHDGPGSSGLSRRAILEQLDDSLRRLGTDYVDLYQIHRFDPAPPVEETMEALHDMVKPGKVRYLGASSRWAWGCQDAVRRATTAGPGSSPCRTSTASCNARTSARCSACSPTRASDRSRGARWPRAVWPARGESRRRAATPIPPPAGCYPTTTSPSPTPSRASPDSAACRWPRSHWPGPAQPGGQKPPSGATKRHLR